MIGTRSASELLVVLVVERPALQQQSNDDRVTILPREAKRRSIASVDVGAPVQEESDDLQQA